MGLSLLLSPHNDDETLFAAFTLMSCQPHVVVCFRSTVQERYGVTAHEREAETEKALEALGLDPFGHLAGGAGLEQWDFPDGHGWDGLEARLRGFAEANEVGCVFAPALDQEGPAEHLAVGEVARLVFGERVEHYLTYRHGGVRAVGREVEPEPWMIPRKLRALACYESQMRTPSLVHFLDPLREYAP